MKATISQALLKRIVFTMVEYPIVYLSYSAFQGEGIRFHRSPFFIPNLRATEIVFCQSLQGGIMPATQKQISITPRRVISSDYQLQSCQLTLFNLKCLKRHTDVSETNDVNFDVLLAILKGMRPVFT